METREVFKNVVEHIGKHLKTDVSHLTMDSNLASSVPGLDSLKMLSLIIYLENTFDLEFEDSKLVSLQTAGGLAEYVKLLMDQKEA